MGHDVHARTLRYEDTQMIKFVAVQSTVMERDKTGCTFRVKGREGQTRKGERKRERDTTDKEIKRDRYIEIERERTRRVKATERSFASFSDFPTTVFGKSRARCTKTGASFVSE